MPEAPGSDHGWIRRSRQTRSVGDMDSAHALVIMMMTLPALIGSAIVAANAQKINAQWRERKAAKRAAASAK